MTKRGGFKNSYYPFKNKDGKTGDGVKTTIGEDDAEHNAALQQRQ